MKANFKPLSEYNKYPDEIKNRHGDIAIKAGAESFLESVLLDYLIYIYTKLSVIIYHSNTISC